MTGVQTCALPIWVEDCDTGGVFGITAGFIKKAKIHAFTLPLAGNKDDLDPANNDFRLVEILDNSALLIFPSAPGRTCLSVFECGTTRRKTSNSSPVA